MFNYVNYITFNVTYVQYMIQYLQQLNSEYLPSIVSTVYKTTADNIKIFILGDRYSKHLLVLSTYIALILDIMDITDKELRHRLKSFNVVVPPVTNSTRKLLQKKLANLESSQSHKNDALNSMPPPKPKAPTNGTNESIMISSYDGSKPSQHRIFDTMDSPSKSTRRRQLYRAPDPFDTSDSEIETGSLGRSIMPANPLITSSSPKSNERSLMNVSDWKNALDASEDPYKSSPGTYIIFIKMSYF